MSRAKPKPLLTDEQWAKIEPLLPKLEGGPEGGRPWADDRACLEGILWVLRTGARWKDLPERYPSPATCWRRLQRWERDGTWVRLWRAFLAELDEAAQLDWSEAFVDGTFFQAKGGARPSGPPRGGRARSAWWWSTAKEFLWGTTWTLRPRRRSPSSRRPSRRSRSRGRARGGRGHDRSG